MGISKGSIIAVNAISRINRTKIRIQDAGTGGQSIKNPVVHIYRVTKD